MRQMDLKAAVAEICQTIRQRKRRGRPSPFCFMVGAGISHPPLPLASEILAECRAEAQEYGRSTPPQPNASQLDAYSHWFEQAHPQPEDRQRYLRRLMENAVISRANFRLAHLLIEGAVSNLVLTANFDDLLSRALTLFGRRHIVCDHPGALQRIDLLENRDVQIIHLHGSYWFYDCCNLGEEISARAQKSLETSFTMNSSLDHVLRHHSPIVVGYGGWVGDVFMDVLKRRLAAPLGTRLYWFFYKRDDAESLPEWLKRDANFVAVVPDLPVQSALSNPEVPGEETRKSGSVKAIPITETAPEPVLDAAAVFDALVAALELKAPRLTSDPLGFFAEQLRSALLGEQQDPATDVYAIHNVIQRVEESRRRESQIAKPTEAEALLEDVRNAVRTADNRGAIQIARSIPLSELTPASLQELRSMLAEAARLLGDNWSDQLLGYDVAVACGDALGLAGKDPGSDVAIAEALSRKGVILGNLNRGEEALGVYDEVVKRFGEASEAALREQVANARRARENLARVWPKPSE
jgi:hypothetical protein